MEQDWKPKNLNIPKCQTIGDQSFPPCLKHPMIRFKPNRQTNPDIVALQIFRLLAYGKRISLLYKYHSPWILTQKLSKFKNQFQHVEATLQRIKRRQGLQSKQTNKTNLRREVPLRVLFIYLSIYLFYPLSWNNPTKPPTTREVSNQCRISISSYGTR